MENHNQEIKDKAMLLQLATPSVDMKERARIWLNLLKYERESNVANNWNQQTPLPVPNPSIYANHSKETVPNVTLNHT